MLRWPLVTRVGFLFQLGVDPRIVKAALEKMNPTPRGLAPAVAAADALVNATNPAKVSQGRIVSDVSVKSGRECANKARKGDGSALPCCKERAGANSLTMLRELYAEDFEKFGYETEVRASRERFRLSASTRPHSERAASSKQNTAKEKEKEKKK